jgi:PAS domain S-box-containing protein
MNRRKRGEFVYVGESRGRDKTLSPGAWTIRPAGEPPEVSALLHASRAILEHKGFDETAEVIFHACKKAVGATSGYVALLSEDGSENEVLFLDSGGLPCSVDPSLPMPIRGLRAEAYRTGKAVYDNRFKESEWRYFMPEGHTPLENVLFAPMSLEGAVMGLLGLGNKPGGFTTEDARLASAFAEMAALAFSHSRALETIKRSEEHLRQANDRAVRILESITEGFFTLDQDLVVTYYNRAAEKLLGRKREDILGRPLFAAFPEARGSVFEDMYRKALAEKYTLSFEVFFEVSPYENWYEVNVFPFDGGISVFFRVATDRHLAEDRHRSSEQRLAQIIDFLPDATFVIDREGKVLAWNRAMEDLTGVGASQMIGKGNHEYALPFYGERRPVMIDLVLSRNPSVEEAYVSFKEEGNRLVSESYIPGLRPGGSYLHNTASVLYDAEENVLGAIESIRDVTDQKLAEKALQESEAKYAKLFKANPIWTSISTLEEGRFIDVNDAFTRVTGFYRDEVIGRASTDMGFYVDPADRERLVALARKQGGFWEEEVIFVKKNGELMTGLWSAEVVEIKGETCLINAIQDITDRKRAEEALRKSEEKYARLFAANPVGISVTTIEEGRFIEVNEGFERLTGFARDELLGRTSLELGLWCEPADRKEIVRLLSEKGAFRELEMTMLKKGGEMTLVLWSGERVVLDGEIAVISVIQDITDRKRVEEALRQNVRLNETLLDALPSVAMLVRAGATVAANEAAKNLGGLPGRRCFNIWGQTEGPCEWCLGNEALSSGSPQGIEVDALGKTWDIHWIPIDSETYLHYAFDITEKRKTEIQLRQAQKMEAIGTLAGGIAHDFNNILGAIIGYAEMMQMFDVPKESPLRNGLDQILTAGRRARDLVKQILAFSRQGPQEKVLVDIGPIVKECLKLLRASLPATIEIKQEIGREPGLIMADPTQIHQVIMNLATNAGHAMEEKGGVMEVYVKPTEITQGAESRSMGLAPGRYIRLTVADTGHGMTHRVMERIFDPYFTTKGQGKGTGLGLAVVHGIARSCGGGVKVSSEPGKGSAFHVFFPTAEGPAEQGGESGGRPLEGKERILFVDDEKSLAELGRAMLVRLGYRVKAMTSPLEALEAFRDEPDGYDLLVTDITMPQMTGDVLAKQVRKIRPGLPVIVMSGFSERMNQEKAKDSGIDGFISKPMLLGDLASSIRRVLDETKR